MAPLNVSLREAGREFTAFVRKYIGVLKTDEIESFIETATETLKDVGQARINRERQLLTKVSQDRWGYHLPEEIIEIIVQYLPTPKDAIRASLACRTWYTYIGYGAKSQALWKALYNQRWNKYASAPRLLAPARPPSAEEREQQLCWFERCIRRERVQKNWEHGVYDLKVLEGHKLDVTHVQFDSKRIVTCSLDRTIKVWDPKTTQCIATLLGHTDGVWSMQYDATRIVSASADQTIKIWDMETYECLDTLHGHTDYVACVMFDDKCIVSGSWDTTLKVWQLNGQLITTLEGHIGCVGCLHLSGNTVVSGSDTGEIMEWSLQTGSCRRSYSETSIPRVDCVQFNDQHIFSGGGDNVIRVWSRETGNVVQRLGGHTQHLNWLQLDADRLISASYDNTLRLWDTENWEMHTIATYNYGFDAWHFQATEEAVVVCSLDATDVEIWDFSTKRKFLPMEESDFRPSRHASRQASRQTASRGSTAQSASAIRHGPSATT